MDIYICKWIKQTFDSWNFIQDIITKLTNLSSSLGRSTLNDSNKI
jgi:hypothetical protein